MTGAELKSLMRERRIKTAAMAEAMDIHPQTIRNLWAKHEVPKVYLMAMIAYVFCLGGELPSVQDKPKRKEERQPTPRRTPSLSTTNPWDLLK